MNQSPMNKIRRIAVLRSLLLDFFFDLRRAIVLPPTAHSKKERPRPIASEEARQSPNNSNKPGRMDAVRAAALLFDKNWRFLLTVQYYSRKAGICKIKSL